MFELDRTLKILATKYPGVFQRILFGDRPGIEFLGVEDTAINIPEQRPDKIFKFRRGKRETNVIFEFMIQPKRKDLKRFYIKNALLTASLRKPVITVIVYLERGKYRTFPYEYTVRLDTIEMSTRFVRILMWEFADRIRSGEFKELAPLLVLYSDQPSKEIILEEKKLINKVQDIQERSDLIALAAMVAFRVFKNGLIKELFSEEYQMMKASNFIEEWILEGWEKGRREGWEKGREEGWEKGREEGWEKGREEGQIKIILNQLKKILGRVSPDLELKIRSLSDREIETLTFDLLDMKAETDLEKWLDARAQNSRKN